MRYERKEYSGIRAIVKNKGYDEQISNILCNLLKYMKENHWCGACHATSAIMYVVFSELGYDVTLCMGEARSKDDDYFDHSWIELDGDIIDLACCMPYNRIFVSEPIILGLESRTGNACSIEYGVYFEGLSDETNKILNMSVSEYLNACCSRQLWTIISELLGAQIDVKLFIEKYSDVHWQYVKNKYERIG